jgi:hypothetical protein
LVGNDEIQLATSSVSFGDFDANGRMDFVYADYPSSNSAPMNIHVVLNQLSSNPNNLCGANSTMGNPFGHDTESIWNSESNGVNDIQLFIIDRKVGQFSLSVSQAAL